MYICYCYKGLHSVWDCSVFHVHCELSTICLPLTKLGFFMSVFLGSSVQILLAVDHNINNININ